MKKSFIHTTLLAVAVYAISTSCAFSKEHDRSFEDGLKSSWSQPALQHGWRGGEKNEHRFGEHQPGEREFGEREFGQHHLGGSHGHEHAWEVQVSPVPEPATDAMMLAGLVVLFVAVRRKTASTTVQTTRKA
jgi:hypothetical protein